MAAPAAELAQTGPANPLGGFASEPDGHPPQHEGQEVAGVPIGQALKSHPETQKCGISEGRISVQNPECTDGEEGEQQECLGGSAPDELVEHERIHHPNQCPKHTRGETHADGLEQTSHRHRVCRKVALQQTRHSSRGAEGPLEWDREHGVDEVSARLRVNVDAVWVAEEVRDLGAAAGKQRVLEPPVVPECPAQVDIRPRDRIWVQHRWSKDRQQDRTIRDPLQPGVSVHQSAQVALL